MENLRNKFPLTRLRRPAGTLSPEGRGEKKDPCHWHNAWAAPLSSIYDVLTCEWCGSMLAARQCAGCRGFYPDTAYEPEIDLVRCPSPQIQWGLLCCPCAALAEEQDPHPSPLPPGEREKESGGGI